MDDRPGSANGGAHVAFIRNVNQGQRGHPRTADVVAAFRDAGAAAVVSFRSNGTVVFDTAGAADAHGVVRDARSALSIRCGIDRPIFTRSLDAVEGLVEQYAGAPDAARLELTLFDEEHLLPGGPDVEDAAAHRRCAIVAYGRGWALLRNERDRESNGTPTVEHMLATHASSRGMPTLAALVDRIRTVTADSARGPGSNRIR